MAILKRTIGVVCMCMALAACAEQNTTQYEAEKTRIEMECKAQRFKTHYERTKCENDGKLSVRKQYGRDVSADYRQYLLERLKNASDLDAKRITPHEAELRDEQALLNYQRIADLRNKKEQAEADQVLQKLLHHPKQETNQQGELHCRTHCPFENSCYTDCNEQ